MFTVLEILSSKASKFFKPFQLLQRVRLIDKPYPVCAEKYVALQFAPLMLGILQQNSGTVSRQLNNNPLSILETNFCGQTPVHLAVLVGNALVLKVVLSFSNEKLLNTRDAYSYYPIDYVTLRQLHKACRTRRASDCEGCMMLEALLNAGSVLFPHALQLGLGWENDATRNSSFAVREILLRHLKDRRMRLQDLAQRRLSKKQRRDLISLADCVLDRYATRAQNLLEDQSIHIPSYLKVHDEHEDPRRSGPSGTIYAYICDQTTAKLSWKLGFRDIGTDCMDGLTQVLRGALSASGTRDETVQTLSDYISWLVDRGLDLQLPIPATLLPEDKQKRLDLRTTGAHYVMKLLGTRIAFRHNAMFKLPKKLSEILLSQFAVDNCSCRCSPSGCNPLMKLFDDFRWTIARSNTEWLHNLPRMCERAFMLFTQNEWQSPSYVWIYQAVIRRITFDALSLRHSCCELVSWRRAPDEEAIKESWVEDNDRLLLLENLCVEFEAKCGGNSKLVQFVRDIWYPRMIDELELLERQKAEKRLTVEERLAAEEVGVNWDTDSSETSTSEDEDEGAVEYFTRMLDDIVPEPDIQVPYGFRLS